MTASAPRQALIVLGMHRSGTSALTGTLHRLGVALGSNLMPPIPGDNDKGFYENDDIVPVHERLFAALGSSWHDVSPPVEDWPHRPATQPFRAELGAVLAREFADAPLWGIKDPRICRFMPLWLDLLDASGAEAKFLLIWRHPFEVAESLRKRQGFDRVKSYQLWFRYMREAETGSRGRPRQVVGYAAFLDDWRTTLGQAAARLDLPGIAEAIDQRAADIDAFLSTDLHRNRADEDRFRAEAPPACVALLARFASATGTDGMADAAAFDAVYADYDAWLAEREPWPTLVADLKRRLVAAEETAALAAAEKATVAGLEQDLAAANAAAAAAAATLERERSATRRLAETLAAEVPLPRIEPEAAEAVLRRLFASRGWRVVRQLRAWRARLAR
jgi:hypothetical protein